MVLWDVTPCSLVASAVMLVSTDQCARHNTQNIYINKGSSNFLSSDPLENTFIPNQLLLISTIETQMQLL
jgi:hypothetical protein